MKTRIKICGLRTFADIDLMNELLPEYCGFIINYPKSIRSLSPLMVRELTCRLDRAVMPVGVFVNSPIELPVRMLREGTIGAAQLHGQEDEEYIRQLQKSTGRPVIKAFHLRSPKDVLAAEACAADYILLDHGLGENGRTLDWGELPQLSRPWFLAGGLTPDNALQAAREAKPFAVDFNSGLETCGFKDPEKTRQAVSAIRNG